MKSKTIWVLGVTLLAASLAAGCNTVKGVGKDIERGGEKIQQQAQ